MLDELEQALRVHLFQFLISVYMKKTENHSRKFLGLTAAIVCFWCIFISVINYLVDPQSQFGVGVMGGYNDNAKTLKYYQITKYPFDALLLGSSKVAAINPDTLIHKKLKFYNGALLSATPEEMYEVLVHASLKPKFVAIGLDFFMFNASEEPFKTSDLNFGASNINTSVYLFSVKTFQKSIGSILNYITDKPPNFFPNGQKNQLKRIKIDSKFGGAEHGKALNHLKRKTFSNFAFEYRRIGTLRKIKTYLEENDIDHVVFVNPLNQSVYKLIMDMRLQSEHQTFLSNVKDIFSNTIDLSYGEWSDDKYFYHSDPWHYRSNTGTNFLNQIFADRT